MNVSTSPARNASKAAAPWSRCPASSQSSLGGDRHTVVVADGSLHGASVARASARLASFDQSSPSRRPTARWRHLPHRDWVCRVSVACETTIGLACRLRRGSDWPGGPVSGTGAGYGGRPKTSAPTLRPPRGVPLGQASLTVSRAVSSPCREPRLQPAVISFDDVVGVLLGHLSGRRDELVEHTRVDGSPVGAHLDRRRSSRQRASEELPCRGQPPSKCNSASLPIYQPTTLTFSAWGLFWPCVMSNSTFCPSSMLR